MTDSRRHPRDDVYRTDNRHVAQKTRVAPFEAPCKDDVYRPAARYVAQKIRVAPFEENSCGTFWHLAPGGHCFGQHV